MFDASLIIFDLDGTLVDSVPDIATGVDRSLADLGYAPAGDSRVREWVGNGSLKLMERALAAAGAEPALLAEAHAHFLRHYAECLDERSTLYPGVEEALEHLRQRELTLAVCTNKPARFVRPLLEKLGIAGYFEILLGGDELPAKKPDPLPLLHLAERFARRVEQCLMVGDSVNDVDAAHAAGMPVVAVSYGYNHGVDIRDCAPNLVLDNLAALPAWIR